MIFNIQSSTFDIQYSSISKLPLCEPLLARVLSAVALAKAEALAKVGALCGNKLILILKIL